MWIDRCRLGADPEQTRHDCLGTTVRVDAIDQVLTRLARIEALDRGQGGAALLTELRLLVGEAEAWARLEGDHRARDAVSKLRNGVGSSNAAREGRVDSPDRAERQEGMR
jgi:hypothetical protein